MIKNILKPTNFQASSHFQKTRYIRYIGALYSELTIIDFPGRIRKDSAVHVRCSCGNEFITTWSAVKNNRIKSCGHIHARYKDDPTQAARRDLYLRYRSSAKSRKLSFTLSFDEFSIITKANCHYCGVEPRQFRKCKGCQAPAEYNGIDRVDSKKGYEPSNVVPCCFICNRAKMNMPQIEFLEYINRLASFASLKSSGKNGESLNGNTVLTS